MAPLPGGGDRNFSFDRKTGRARVCGKRGGCRSDPTRDFGRQEAYAPRRADA